MAGMVGILTTGLQRRISDTKAQYHLPGADSLFA
jgi:hypothetical protein